jgi:type II secretory pathway pseudopilin PulG
MADTGNVPEDVPETVLQASPDTLARNSQFLAIVAAFLFFGSLIYRILSLQLTFALDFGHPSFPMALGMLLGLSALILGVVSVWREGRTRRAIRGIVIGGLVILFPFLLFAIAFPVALVQSQRQSRMVANESTAIASIRTINRAMDAYESSYPAVGFPSSLDVLGGTSCALPNSASACLIDPALASGSNNGYTFKLVGVTGNLPGEPAVRYQIIAAPVDPTRSGELYFCSTKRYVAHDEGVVRVSDQGIKNCSAGFTWELDKSPFLFLEKAEHQR